MTGTGDDGGSSIGGLVGTHWYDDSIISNSYATGNVTGEHFVGGLVGLVWGGHIRTSYATGDVTGKGSCVDAETFESTPCTPEGLASGDHYENVTTRIGGLVGGNRGATISTSFASGDVTGMHHVGGLVGENIGRTIRATYAHGDVTVTGSTEMWAVTRMATRAVESVGWWDEISTAARSSTAMRSVNPTSRQAICEWVGWPGKAQRSGVTNFQGT